MSFREKRAWVTLITLIFILALFWLHVPPTRMLAPAPSMWRIRSPLDARAPKDEREQLTELKSRAIAWYVFVILSIGGIFVTIHAGANEVGLGFVVLFAFVVAEIVNYSMRIYYYRRGF